MLRLVELENKKIYLAPYNNESIEFSKSIISNKKIAFLGFIDNYQVKENVYKTTEISNEFDFIIILSANYYNEISTTLLKNKIKNKKIYYAKKAFPTFLLYSSQLRYRLSTFHILNLSIKDYTTLIKLKNIHKNKRAFIIGNGPSLSISNLNKLQNEITFAANKIYLSYKETQWRPSYYFVTDKLVYEQNLESIQILQEKSFFSFDMLKVTRLQNATYFNLNYKHPVKFGLNPITNMYSGSTVVFVMLEFAIYMGIKEIYIIGLDFSFDLPTTENNKELISQGEKNHFHKDYRKVGEKWTMPNMQRQTDAFKKAIEFAKLHNIKIYNASQKTKLNVFQRIDFDTLF